MGDHHHERTAPGMAHILVSAAKRECCLSNNSVLLLDVNANGDFLPCLSVFQYEGSFLDRLSALHLVLVMRVVRHSFYMTP